MPSCTFRGARQQFGCRHCVCGDGATTHTSGTPPLETVNRSRNWIYRPCIVAASSWGRGGGLVPVARECEFPRLGITYSVLFTAPLGWSPFSPAPLQAPHLAAEGLRHSAGAGVLLQRKLMHYNYARPLLPVKACVQACVPLPSSERAPGLMTTTYTSPFHETVTSDLASRPQTQA